MSKDTGGQAFPSPCRSVADEMVNLEYRGMTLRDYFAAKAMVGILSGNLMDAFKSGNIPTDIASSAISVISYELADAMLKERAK